MVALDKNFNISYVCKKNPNISICNEEGGLGLLNEAQ